MTVADKIAELEALLDDAVESVAVDGVSTDWNLEEARRRLAELKRQQTPAARPRNATIDLSGF